MAAITGAVLAGAMLAGCGSSTPEASDDVTVVATTTIWGDIAEQLVQCAGAGQVSTLMPVGVDPHDYSPSAKDVTSMVGADLVVANGLGLEEGLAASLESARDDGAQVFEVAPQLQPIPFAGEHGDDEDHGAEDDHADEDDGADEDHGAEADEDHGAEADPTEGDHGDEADEEHGDDDHGHGDLDPHAWLDASRVATAAALIGEELERSTGNAQFRDCGQELQQELADLHDELTETLAEVPADRRVLVTDHDSFGYFAQAYGYEVAGVVIPGGSTLAEPSSAEMADLVAAIRASGVDAIFANTANPQALIDSLATEVGDIDVIDLYVGSVGGPGSGAETYQSMMTTNAQRISGALAD